LRLTKAHQFLGMSKMRARAQVAAQEASISSSSLPVLNQVNSEYPFTARGTDLASSVPTQRAKVSLLGLRQPEQMKPAPMHQSQELLMSLSNHLQGLPKQQEEGKLALKSIFMKRFQDGIRARQLMESDAQRLNTQVAVEQSVQRQLREVVSALAGQRTHYHKRLVGLKLFLEKISDPQAYAAAEI